MCFCVSLSYCLLSPRSQCSWSPLAQLGGLCWWAVSVLTILVRLSRDKQKQPFGETFGPLAAPEELSVEVLCPFLAHSSLLLGFVHSSGIWLVLLSWVLQSSEALLTSVCEILWLCLNLSSFVTNVRAASNQLFNFQPEWPFFYLKRKIKKNQRCVLSSPLWLGEKK